MLTSTSSDLSATTSLDSSILTTIRTDNEPNKSDPPTFIHFDGISSDSSQDNDDLVEKQHDPQTPEPRTPDLLHVKHLGLLDKILSAKGALVNMRIEPNDTVEARPLRGTTLYIGKCNVDTRFGEFQAYVFQDLIGKHYILAMVYGQIKNIEIPFYIRVHSSCVTSETLRGCDCDCVQQLEGAMKIISEKKHGILFYLLQEGRGVSYVAKARDRMLVQASLDQISTFEAYRVMGLKNDHRHYENIPQICHLLGIDNAEFIVLTNNPAKIQALKDNSLKVIRCEQLEFESSPFNAAYLSSKQASGHLLRSPSHSTLRSKSAPEPVPLFKPYIVDDAQRFIYCASYYLPMKPINDKILLTEQQFYEMFKHRSIDYYMNMPNPCILNFQGLRNKRFLIKIDPNNLRKYEIQCRNDPVCELLTTPYWFKIHVYYDIITTREFVILTHGTAAMSDYPIVRLQMESLFNRFPLRHTTYRDRLKKSVELIVRYGIGIILLLVEDGRGAGLAAYVIDRMLLEKGTVANSDEARKKTLY